MAPLRVPNQTIIAAGRDRNAAGSGGVFDMGGTGNEVCGGGYLRPA